MIHVKQYNVHESEGAFHVKQVGRYGRVELI